MRRRLERTDARRDDHRAGIESSTGGRAQREATVFALRELRDFLSQVERRVERTDLLHQPVHELLRAAHGQRRNVVDRFVGIELGALAARVRERVDEMRADTQKPELEHLEQAAGPAPTMTTSASMGVEAGDVAWLKAMTTLAGKGRRL